MATITKSIGATARDYATPALFAAAIPSNLVTADEKWVGECYNDAEFVGAGIMFDCSGKTTDATRNIVLTAAAGHSHIDHGTAAANALKYDVSKGVGIRMTGVGNWVIRPGGAYTEIRRLQIKADAADSLGINGAVNEGTARKYHDLIIETGGEMGIDAYDNALLTNVICINLGTTANGARLGNGSKAIGCGVVRASNQTAAGIGWRINYGTCILQSCYSFGFTTAADASGWDGTNSKYNATDAASGLPGTNNQHSVSYSQFTPFTDASSGAPNFNPIAATLLAANGFRDATLAPNDIAGTARSATPTIGPKEIGGGGGSGGGTGAAMYHHLRMIGAY